MELKCLFVRCRKYPKSWWNDATELHNLVDLLCGTAAAKLLHNSVDLLCVTPNGRHATQLGRFTLWHNGCRATQLGRFTFCGTMAAELLHNSEIYFVWHRMAAKLHNSVDLLCVTLNGRQATQLGRFTLWHNGRRATTQLSTSTLCDTEWPPSYTTR